ncbi:MAG: hypothetical protein F6K25_24530 [Okeania sp. SIO2G4]|uniref:hypothetical protein n=1 Tax=unclassified Okeania TaxID=2634635 RepID=UPI0013B6F827|nr:MULTISPECIES: hypothetical protein [unclassified Okeania]NEP07064.1 hypothetical protein [Okeania sp. SIO4D6]NEP74838.1 hypothetical protein [Okeania sp. SIO2G5]NEP94308.1 hypothetical protein [Okeania sp. SIO2F5]NEQ93655.1 hypothetical protein [Okeania sp. SIO2G4]
MKLAHIINPVAVQESSDLFIAQPITFQTMKSAQEIARGYGVDVTLYSAQFPEDHSIVPEGFFKTPDLERSVLDIANFKTKRKLPLIQDILNRLDNATDAEYLIYTNVDIALMPNFYVFVCKIIDQGYDAFIINRRTISKAYTKVEDIPLMYAELGENHPGHDCFVFKKSAYSKYKLYKECIGAPPIGKALAINLISNAENFKEFKDLHLTFHLGADMAWARDLLKDYTLYNLREFDKIVTYYTEIGKPAEHPLIASFSEHIRKLLL